MEPLSQTSTNEARLSEILLSFGQAISATLGMGMHHSSEMAKITYMIAKSLHLSDVVIHHLVISALLHDIGISSFKKDFLKISSLHDSDIFQGSDLDIFTLLNFSKQQNMTPITDMILSHSLEGVQFLKQSNIKHMLYNILGDTLIYSQDYLPNNQTDMASYLSKIVFTADLLECATNSDSTPEEKTKTSVTTIQQFASSFLDGDLATSIFYIIKEKEFWEHITNHTLFELFTEFQDTTYTLFSPELYNFLTLFAMFIDIKSPHTARHSTNVAKLSKKMAMHVGMSKETCEEIYYSALIHDVGKLAVPSSILEKPGRLTYEEYTTMKLHPEIGLHILSPLKNMQKLISYGAYHHERLNGSGYPFYLTESQLPEESFIVAIADVYDALTATRPYRRGMPKTKAMHIIKSDAGPLFSNRYVDILEAVVGGLESSRL